MKVGDAVYVFDENRRKYTRDERGGGYGQLIYREHFMETKIVGETARSWVVEYWNKKLPKKPHYPLGGILDAKQVDDMVWLHDHRYRVSNMVGSCNDVSALRQIAALIGYAPEQP